MKCYFIKYLFPLHVSRSEAVEMRRGFEGGHTVTLWALSEIEMGGEREKDFMSAPCE